MMNIQDIDFDTPFLSEGGNLTTHDESLYSVYAPDVFDGEYSGSDIEIDGVPWPSDSLICQWSPLVGFTNQEGYNGAVLHSSEQAYGAIENHVKANPGIYVMVAVEVHPDPAPCCRAQVTDPGGECEPGCAGTDRDIPPAGWAVLRLKD